MDFGYQLSKMLARAMSIVFFAGIAAGGLAAWTIYLLWNALQ